MAKYTSRYVELGFYVNGTVKRFASGQFVTEDAAEIAVLDALVDAKREDEVETKEPEAPATQTKAPRKPSAK